MTVNLNFYVFLEQVRRRGGHFRSKKLRRRIFCILIVNFGKNVQKGGESGGGGHCQSKKCHCKFTPTYEFSGKKRKVISKMPMPMQLQQSAGPTQTTSHISKGGLPEGRKAPNILALPKRVAPMPRFVDGFDRVLPSSGQSDHST